ncbi:hypothetical protein TYRP_005301 [Tyrophagus putrescentiae]|nr:hypothetical protein TYRP_005301 [Tyrophagus putrescentiae]
MATTTNNGNSTTPNNNNNINLTIGDQDDDFPDIQILMRQSRALRSSVELSVDSLLLYNSIVRRVRLMRDEKHAKDHKVQDILRRELEHLAPLMNSLNQGSSNSGNTDGGAPFGGDGHSGNINGGAPSGSGSNNNTTTNGGAPSSNGNGNNGNNTAGGAPSGDGRNWRSAYEYEDGDDFFPCGLHPDLEAQLNDRLINNNNKSNKSNKNNNNNNSEKQKQQQQQKTPTEAEVLLMSDKEFSALLPTVPVTVMSSETQVRLCRKLAAELILRRGQAPPADDSQVHKCSEHFCLYASSDRSNLRRHLQQQHFEPAVAHTSRCPICPYTSNGQGIRRHLEQKSSLISSDELESVKKCYAAQNTGRLQHYI